MFIDFVLVLEHLFGSGCLAPAKVLYLVDKYGFIGLGPNLSFCVYMDLIED